MRSEPGYEKRTAMSNQGPSTGCAGSLRSPTHSGRDDSFWGGRTVSIFERGHEVARRINVGSFPSWDFVPFVVNQLQPCVASHSVVMFIRYNRGFHQSSWEG